MKKKVILEADPETGMGYELATPANIKRAKPFMWNRRIVEVDQDLLDWYDGARRSLNSAQKRMSVLFDSAPNPEAK